MCLNTHDSTFNSHQMTFPGMGVELNNPCTLILFILRRMLRWILIEYFCSIHFLRNEDVFSLDFIACFNLSDCTDWLILRSAFYSIKKSFRLCINDGANLSCMQRNNYIIVCFEEKREEEKKKQSFCRICTLYPVIRICFKKDELKIVWPKYDLGSIAQLETGISFTHEDVRMKCAKDC